jgi:hypothetical protein
MLNLLFISDNPKAMYIKSVLQPDLKVIIDVVSDFDLGLKNIFAKRPSIVCIQDQINGVTGENVARHIQMLLGNNTPKFILLLTGNGNARLIKGLYDHIVDLNQQNETVAKDITSTLKALLGDEWDKIYTPPRLTPALVRSSAPIPEELQDDIDKLIVTALSSHKPSGSSAVPSSISGLDTVPPPSITQTDPSKLSEKTAVAHTVANKHPVTSEITSTMTPEAVQTGIEKPKTCAANSNAVVASTPKLDPITAKPPAPPVIPDKPAPSATSQKAPPLVQPMPPPAATTEIQTAVAALQQSTISEKSPECPTPVGTEYTEHVHHPAPGAKAEISSEEISQSTPDSVEHGTVDLHPAPHERYQPAPAYLRRSASIAVVIAAVCVIGFTVGWYFVTQKPLWTHMTKQNIPPLSETRQVSTVVPAAVPAPKPIQPTAPQQVATQQSLEFILKKDRDPSYAKNNPGWERYAGADAEFRVFSVSERIQAIQVFAVKNKPISKPIVNAVLHGFAGSSDCRITSRSVESGVRIESGTIRNKYDVMLYRKDGALVAFAVSIN